VAAGTAARKPFPAAWRTGQFRAIGLVYGFMVASRRDAGRLPADASVPWRATKAVVTSGDRLKIN